MTKADLIRELAQDMQITQVAAAEILTSLTTIITREIKDTGRMKIDGLGVFTKRHREARMVNIAKGPEAGTKKRAEARNTVHFKPAPAIKEAVNQ